MDALDRVDAALQERAFRPGPMPASGPLGKLSILGGRRKRLYGARAARAIEKALRDCARRACADEPEYVQEWVKGMERGIRERLSQCEDAGARGGPEAKRARLSRIAGKCVDRRAATAAVQQRIRAAAKTVDALRYNALQGFQEQAAHEAGLLEPPSDGGGAAAVVSPAEERAHVSALESAARDIKRTSETIPARAAELQELISVVEDQCERRKRARGADGAPASPQSSARGSASSHVLQPVARLAQHLSQTESLVDFLGGGDH